MFNTCAEDEEFVRWGELELRTTDEIEGVGSVKNCRKEAE